MSAPSTEDALHCGVVREDGVFRSGRDVALYADPVRDDFSEVQSECAAQDGEADHFVIKKLFQRHGEELEVVDEEEGVLDGHESRDVLRGGHCREVAVIERDGARDVAEVHPVVDHGHDVISRAVGEDGRDLIQDPPEGTVAGDDILLTVRAHAFGVVESVGGKVEHGDGRVHILLRERGGEVEDNCEQPAPSQREVDDPILTLFCGEGEDYSLFEQVRDVEGGVFRLYLVCVGDDDRHLIAYAEGVADVDAPAREVEVEMQSGVPRAHGGGEGAGVRAHLVRGAVPCLFCGDVIGRDVVARGERKEGDEEACKQYYCDNCGFKCAFHVVKPPVRHFRRIRRSCRRRCRRLILMR